MKCIAGCTDGVMKFGVLGFREGGREGGFMCDQGVDVCEKVHVCV